MCNTLGSDAVASCVAVHQWDLCSQSVQIQTQLAHQLHTQVSLQDASKVLKASLTQLLTVPSVLT